MTSEVDAIMELAATVGVKLGGVIIIAAAMRHGEIIVSQLSPARHRDLVAGLNAFGVSPHDWEQGFLTLAGTFLDRRLAADAALLAGQIKALRFNKHELFSEDLW